ncbi:protein MIZU-KUSSEI 1-like [Diospyros lotus]|uniref:protein MIZU-KUSSEI 1-like n=1 Tax=Diospyros lotus TaxID=55363 RepID=UPI002256FA09|nr:protein MIZU-KUSSEI 1-like [Diospyros lotus]
MAEPTPRAPASRPSFSSSTSSTPPKSSPPPPPPPQRPGLQPALVEPSNKSKKRKSSKALRVFRSVFRSFPIIAPAPCKLASLPGGFLPDVHLAVSRDRITGTLYGYRKGRVNLSLQENPRTLPTVVIELAMQTSALQKEMSAGMVRIALESEKRAEREKALPVLQEAVWTMYCNGKKNGYGVKREATEEDLQVMELLRATSMGAGVLPVKSDVESADGELAYMRAHFQHVVGSKDSETLYMLSPDSNSAPELSIFFVRI